MRKVFSIFLTSKKYTEPQEMHCPHCGHVLMHYYSDIKLVVDGVTSQRDHNGKRFVLRCKRCKAECDIL